MSNTVRMRYVLNDSFLQFLKSKLTLAWSNSCLHCKLDNCSLSKYIYSFLLSQCFHNVSLVMYSFKCVLGSKVGFVIVQKKSLQKLNSSGQEKWMWIVQNSLTFSNSSSQVGCCHQKETREIVSCGLGTSCVGQCSDRGASLCPSGVCSGTPADWVGCWCRQCVNIYFICTWTLSSAMWCSET